MSWMPCILSTIVTGTVGNVNLDFDMLDEDSGWSLELLIGAMERNNHLERIDEVLNRDNFVNLNTVLVTVAVMTRIALVRTLGYTVAGERWTRWEELVREKMPLAERRGVLRYVQ